MKMMMAGVGKMFKTRVTSLSVTISSDAYLSKCNSASGFVLVWILSLSERSWWSVAKVPFSFPELNFSLCRSSHCYLLALPCQNELPGTPWTSRWVPRELRHSSCGKMWQSSSTVAVLLLPVVCRLFPHCVCLVSVLQTNKDLVSSEAASLIIKTQILRWSKPHHTDQDNESEKVKM